LALLSKDEFSRLFLKAKGLELLWIALVRLGEDFRRRSLTFALNLLILLLKGEKEFLLKELLYGGQGL